jgi:basic membrane protein A
MDKFSKETGVSYKEFETMNETHGEQFLRQLARRGADIIVTTGFDQIKPVEKIAKEFPDVKFTLIDGFVDLPNVQSIIFKDEEGSFLVGAVAALKLRQTKSVLLAAWIFL